MDGTISLLFKVSQNIFYSLKAIMSVKINRYEFRDRNSFGVKMGQA
jgi:hypothetical protein